MEWEKIFENNATHKGLMSKMYKWLIQLHIKQTIQSKKRKSTRLKETFFPRHTK